MNSETIDNYVDQVIKDLQTASKYTVSDTERDELRITGRMCIFCALFEANTGIFAFSSKRNLATIA